MNTTIDPADMLLFATVVREGGFSAAARALGWSRQRVSETVSRLEGRLGVRLLERTTRRVAVTDAGQAYAARCLAIAAQVDEANAEVQARSSTPVGRVRLTAPVLYGRWFLMPIVAEVLRRHPQVALDVVLADRRVDLLEEGFDLAIRAGALTDSGLTARALGVAQVVVVGSPSLLAGRPPPAAGAWDTWPCVTTRAQERWPLGATEVTVRAALQVNDLEAARDAAVAGAGLARLPRFACAAALAAGRLVEVSTVPPTPTPVHLLAPSRAFVPARVRVVADALLAGAGRLDPH